MGQGNGQNNHDELHWNTAMGQRDGVNERRDSFDGSRYELEVCK
jgi:hypothetical protein